MDDLHGQIMNLNPEKRKQNLAIDEAMKKHKNMSDIMAAIYARAFRDAKHAAAEKASEFLSEMLEPPTYDQS